MVIGVSREKVQSNFPLIPSPNSPKLLKVFSNSASSEEVDSSSSVVGETLESVGQSNLDICVEEISPAVGGLMKSCGPILENVVNGPDLVERVCGPNSKVGILMGEGLMSFDGACRNLREAKSKTKKTKIVEDGG